MLEDRLALGPLEALPDVRARRLLRLIAGPSRHKTLSRHRASGRSILSAGRKLDVVLRRRSFPGLIVANLPGQARELRNFGSSRKGW